MNLQSIKDRLARPDVYEVSLSEVRWLVERLEAADGVLAHNIRDRVIRLIGDGYRSAEEQQPFFPDVPRDILDAAFAEPFVAALAKEAP